MKKYIVLVMCLFLAITCFAGCTNPKETVSPGTSPDPSIGGLKIDVVSGTIPQDIKDAFDKLYAGTVGVSRTPIAFIGEQTSIPVPRFAVLFSSRAVVPDAEVFLNIVTFSKASDGTVEIINEKAFDYTAYVGNEIKIEDSELLDGGWAVPAEGGLNIMPNDLATATAGDGLKYENTQFQPLAILADQIVAGTNYILICRAVENDKPNGLYIVKFNVSLNREGTILSATKLDVTALVAD